MPHRLSMCCDQMQMLYFQRALTEYKALFGTAMDDYIKSDIWPLIEIKQKLGLGKRPCPVGDPCPEDPWKNGPIA